MQSIPLFPSEHRGKIAQNQAVSIFRPFCMCVHSSSTRQCKKFRKRLTPSSFPSSPNPSFPSQKPDIYFFLSVCSLSTFFTIFCSSMRKARTTRSWTQLAHREPPYDRLTDFWGLEIWEYSRGRRAGTYGCRVSCDVRLVVRSRGRVGLEVPAKMANKSNVAK